MKKHLILISALLLSAQAFSDTKIGYVNMQAAVAQEDEAQKVINEIKAEQQKLAEQAQKTQVEFQAEVAKFEAAQAKLDDKAKVTQGNALRTKFNDLQKQLTQQEEALQKKHQEKLSDLERKNALLIEAIAKEGKYAFVQKSETLLYVSPEMVDLTGELVKRFNVAYKVKADPKNAQGKTPAKK